MDLQVHPNFKMWFYIHFFQCSPAKLLATSPRSTPSNTPWQAQRATDTNWASMLDVAYLVPEYDKLRDTSLWMHAQWKELPGPGDFMVST